MSLAARTFRPDKDLIRRMRISLGKTPEKLAEDAGCSARTIQNLEKGKPAYLATLREVAKALGLSINKLIPDLSPSEEEDPLPCPPHQMGFTLTCHIPFSLFDQTEEFEKYMRRFKEIIQQAHELSIEFIRDGSVIIGTLIGHDDARSAFIALCEGRLSKLRITGFELYIRTHSDVTFWKELWDLRKQLSAEDSISVGQTSATPDKSILNALALAEPPPDELMVPYSIAIGRKSSRRQARHSTEDDDLWSGNADGPL